MQPDRIGRYLSFILRHRPDAIGITLDRHGWADVRELLKGLSQTYPMTLESLQYIVEHDDKKRYAFNPDKTKIRASHGHSIAVDVELKPATPPDCLYHGTAQKYLPVILREGLKPKSRLYVHLSETVESAEEVGWRHGKPAILVIQSCRMAEDGYPFYIAENGIWMTKEVPTRYVKWGNGL